MTMQSSGPISMGQAMAECQIGEQNFDAGSTQLSQLAGTTPGRPYTWSDWYGKSNGVQVTENGTQYFDVNYSGANNTNFSRSLQIYAGGGFRQTGGDNDLVGNYPAGATNGFNIAGFYRSGTSLTVMAGNCSLDGVSFQSSIGDNVTLTNDISISAAFGPNLWTFYGANGAVAQGGGRTYTVKLVGTAQRPQPPAGYQDGQPPAPAGSTPPDSGGGGGSCFVAGSLVLMADRTWKQVQTVEAGDMVMGPTGPVKVKRLHITKLEGYRRLMTFAEDPRHMWSEEHPYWAKKNNKQWWWAEGPDHLRAEMASGLLPGLRDPYSVLEGKVDFASLEGFVQRTPVTVIGADPETPLFVPVIEGSPIFINGYMVSGFVNEFGYDYEKLDWNEHVSKFELDRAHLALNLEWIKKYHDYFKTLA